MALKFGTSGVRGLVTEMTDRECALYTLAFLDYLQTRQAPDAIVIGGDYRASTPRILRAVAHAILRRGRQVVHAGLVPTPALAHFAMQRGLASIMVTGSHIPDDRNGIKFNLPWGEVLKADEQQISARYRELAGAEPADAFNADGALSQPPDLGEPLADVARDYIARYAPLFPANSLHGRRYVVYQHSSVGRDLIPAILRQAGAEVITVGWSDTFVPVDTEAVAEPECLAAWVAEHHADALVSADGDSDRPLVVDDRGRVVRGDVLGILVARYLRADAVATPVSCNSALELAGFVDDIRRTRIGSPYVIEALNAALADGRQRVMGYEANGGFLLASPLDGPGGQLAPLPTRDAALPILCLLQAAVDAGRPVSALVDELPPRFTWSGLLRQVPSELGQELVRRLDIDRDAIAAPLLQQDIAAWDFTDGARMTLAGGAIVHLRPSGNAPEFRVYTEAATEAAAIQLNDATAARVRDAIGRYRDAHRWLEPDCQRLANVALMNRCPRFGGGMDIVIVSTTSPRDEAWWQHRLEAGRGQIIHPHTRVLAIYEDWPGGAGNGLGTLFALRQAQAKGQQLWPGFDLIGELERGASVALYHTAGKGTRMAPLPASEGNNKPAIRLPAILDIDGRRVPISILEAAIKQTAIYARARNGRLSVFWGDQVFVPSNDPCCTAAHHIDIIGQLGPMPDEETWRRRGLCRYGLLAVDETGNAVQLEKITHQRAVELAHRGTIRTGGGVGVSIGSFSLSSHATRLLLDNFAAELDRRSGRYDTDPHFWMPMTLDLRTYLEIMTDKGIDPDWATAHHARMQRLADHLRTLDPALGLLGVVDAGSESYWWDYGQIRHYLHNLLLLTRDSTEAATARAFYGLDHCRQLGNELGPDVDIDDNSCVIGCRIAAGRIHNSVLVDVQADRVDVSQAVMISSRAAAFSGHECVAYNASCDQAVALGDQAVRVDVSLGGCLTTFCTTIACSGTEAWEQHLPGNPCSFAELYQRVQDDLAEE